MSWLVIYYAFVKGSDSHLRVSSERCPILKKALVAQYSLSHLPHLRPPPNFSSDHPLLLLTPAYLLLNFHSFLPPFLLPFLSSNTYETLSSFFLCLASISLPSLLSEATSSNDSTCLLVSYFPMSFL